jgi:Uma2 family endonuclease
MTMNVAEKLATYADYVKTPEGAAYQLINGELIMAAPPGIRHQEVAANIFNKLSPFVRKHKLGKVFHAPTDVYFSNHETFQPDILFIETKRLNIIEEECINGAPDVVFEILSPTTGYYDLAHKKNVYESSRVTEYWVVDPREETIELFENKSKKFVSLVKLTTRGTIHSKLIAGFSLKLENVFEGI